jgi:glycosyltransferase involved in cell wall biosynthesis/SAM-dependent methyltransferase
MLFKNRKHKPAGLTIAYLLEDTSLCGGVKVVFEHALLLSENGFLVTIVTKGSLPGYYELGNVEFVHIDKTFEKVAELLSRFDIVIATSFRQVLELYHLPINLAHFSQGFEADYPYWEQQREEVQRAYHLPIPKITISKRVSSLVKDCFLQTPYYMPQGIDLNLFYKKKPCGTITKVILVGVWENKLKGIRDAVEGFISAKKAVNHLKLVRISALPLSDEERSLYNPDEYYTAITPKDMGDIYRQCDLAIVPSLEGEGFGLPAIEAMACGLPVILTRIHSFLSFHDTKDYAYFVSPNSPVEISEGIIQLCRRTDLVSYFSKRARDVAEGYPIEKTMAQLIEILKSLAKGYHLVEKEDITFIYIEKQHDSTSSLEVTLLGELSKNTFCQGHPMKSIITKDPAHITIHEVLKGADTTFIAISLDDTTYFSKMWLSPLVDILNKDIELASPVCSDFFEIPIPYYSPLTFNDVADYMMQKHEGQSFSQPQFPLLSFLVKRDSLSRLNPDTPLSELPEKIKSALVPSSLVHRFGDYYSSKRDDLLPYIPYGINKVLDIGCAKGFLGELIKKERGCKVFGVELDKNIAEMAKSRLDDVFCLNIDHAQLPFKEDIDVIICADILEHLFDPWRVLENAKKWLKPDGIIIASLPNTAHYSIISDLLKGRWDYIPFGLLCVTHLRFFTKKSIEDMFIKSGYSILTMSPQAFPRHLKEQLSEMLGKVIRSENASPEIFCPGYYVVAKKSIP